MKKFSQKNNQAIDDLHRFYQGDHQIARACRRTVNDILRLVPDVDFDDILAEFCSSKKALNFIDSNSNSTTLQLQLRKLAYVAIRHEALYQLKKYKKYQRASKVYACKHFTSTMSRISAADGVPSRVRHPNEFSELSSSGDDPADIINSQLQIKAAYSKLNKREKEIVALSFFQPYTDQEIAKQVGSTVDSVRVVRSRCQAKIKAAIY